MAELVVKYEKERTYKNKAGTDVSVPSLTEWSIGEEDDGYYRPILHISDNVHNPKGIGMGIIAALNKAGIKLITDMK